MAKSPMAMAKLRQWQKFQIVQVCFPGDIHATSSPPFSVPLTSTAAQSPPARPWTTRRTKSSTAPKPLPNPPHCVFVSPQRQGRAPGYLRPFAKVKEGSPYKRSYFVHLWLLPKVDAHRRSRHFVSFPSGPPPNPTLSCPLLQSSLALRFRELMNTILDLDSVWVHHLFTCAAELKTMDKCLSDSY